MYFVHLQMCPPSWYSVCIQWQILQGSNLCSILFFNRLLFWSLVKAASHLWLWLVARGKFYSHLQSSEKNYWPTVHDSYAWRSTPVRWDVIWLNDEALINSCFKIFVSEVPKKSVCLFKILKAVCRLKLKGQFILKN